MSDEPPNTGKKRGRPRKRSLAVADCDPAEVNQVLKWILKGTTAYDVREAIAATYPERDAATLILAAMEELKKAADFEPAVVTGWVFEAYRDLYRRMTEAGDYTGALRAAKLIADLARLHVPNESEPEPEAKPDAGQGNAGRLPPPPAEGH